MSNRLIEGDRVYLRRVTPADATLRYAGWLNDPETTRYLESGRMEETVASLREYINAHTDRDDVLFTAIVLKDGDRHVGNIKLEPVNRRHGHAVLGIMIGDASVRGKGIGQEAVVLMLRYAFETLKLHRVALGVTADNVAAIHCYERVGFVHEGRFREAVLREGGYIDNLYMSVLADEFFARYGRA